jgi:filamentous hemagglutinin
LKCLREKIESIGRGAERLGFDRRILPQKAPFDSHGEDVFTDGKTFITRDVDGHCGGVWKMFNRRGTRMGAYDANLNRIGN